MSLFALLVTPLIAMSQSADLPAAYDNAVAARMAGEFAEAETEFEAIVAAHPEHADAWLQLGLSRSAQGDFDGANMAFQRTLDLAPDYPDAWLGRARIAFFRSDLTNARRYARRAGDSEEARALLARIDAAETPVQPLGWRIDIFGGTGSLTNGLENWTEFGLALGRRLDDTTALTFQVDTAQRFGMDDQFYALRLDRRLSDLANAYLAIGGAPDPIFRPEISLRAGVEGAFADTGWRGSLDVFHGNYQSGDVQSVTLGVYRDLAGSRARVGARLIGLSDEAGDTRSGYAVTGEWQATEPARLILSYTDAPETSEGVTLDVQAYSAALRYQFNDRQGFSFTLVHEERRAYNRTAFVAGASWRF